MVGAGLGVFTFWGAVLDFGDMKIWRRVLRYGRVGAWRREGEVRGVM